MSHVNSVDTLRMKAKEWSMALPGSVYAERRVMFEAAATLLEVHDMTGVSLDRWTGPKELVERCLVLADLPPFEPNGV